MHSKETKRVSLIAKFINMVVVFGVVTLAINGAFTYVNQTIAYHRESENNLRKITAYLENRIQAEGEDFKEIKEYFEHHHEQMQIRADFDKDYSPEYREFEELFQKEYPGRVLGVDITFSDLSEEVKAAYALYRYEYWLSVFNMVEDSFGIAYTYFIYPTEEPDVCYMIDPVPDTKTVDGKEYLLLAPSGSEDPDKYPMMWESWHTGQAPSGFDIFDNQYGNNYAYYAPVIINGEKVGIVGAEITVASVTSAIINAVISQVAGYTIVLLFSIILMIALVRKIIIKRLFTLEKAVVEYSDSKDQSIAANIENQEKGNDEIRSLADHFSQMIIELEDYMVNLQKVTAEKERIGAELNLATQIQADMLPRIFPPFPEIAEFDLYASMDPAKEVGGDFYDFFLVDEDHVALVVADVSGKGVPAALFMVIAKTLIKNRTLMGGGPGEILTDVNNQLCEGNDAELFVTVWLAIIEISTGKGVAANAGHEHPALKRRDGSFEMIKYRHSLVLAAMEGIPFREHEFELHPGDVLVQYTDGVSEATDAHKELFGEERILKALNRESVSDPKVLLSALREEIDGFAGEAPQFDDITMLGFYYKGKNT